MGVMALGLTACASTSTPQPKRDVGTVNFKYAPTDNESPTNKTIAIVSPLFKSVEAQHSQVNQFATMVQRSHTVNFNNDMGNYNRRLSSSMVNTFNEIVISKGFTISGPYDSFDDITFGDKKTSYLALVPNIEVYIDQKRINAACVQSQNYCEDVGTIQIGGSLNIKLVEPLTGQTFLSKRVNLSDLNQSREYVRRVHQAGPQKGLLLTAMDAAVDAAVGPAQQKPLIDNTDKVLVDALNEFYAGAMAKVDSYLSREEILSFESDVEKVKELKRF